MATVFCKRRVGRGLVKRLGRLGAKLPASWPAPLSSLLLGYARLDEETELLACKPNTSSIRHLPIALMSVTVITLDT